MQATPTYRLILQNGGSCMYVYIYISCKEFTFYSAYTSRFFLNHFIALFTCLHELRPKLI
jgi:hypothetical protein